MIIGLVGRRRTGKNSLSRYIVEKYFATELALASYLKETVKIWFGWSEDHVNGLLKDVVDPFWGVSPRQMLQWFGTEVVQFSLPERFPEYRTIVGRLHWCNLLIKDLEYFYLDSMLQYNRPVVITDVRFPHEVEAISSFARKIKSPFKMIKIVRDTGFFGDDHSSETDSDGIVPDLVLENNGTLEQLFEQFESLFEHRFQKRNVI
jgi:hypothetical protein